MVFYEAELGVETDIFVDVTCGVVWFGAKDGADLKDAFKDSHHDLFVELWALRKVCGSSKVVQLKDVRATFSGRGNDLGCLYFGELAGAQCRAKTSHGACRQSQDGAARQVTIRHDGMVEQGTNAGCNFTLVERHRGYLGDRRDNLDARLVQFNSAWRLTFADDYTLDGYDTFHAEYAVLEWSQLGFGAGHHLDD